MASLLARTNNAGIPRGIIAHTVDNPIKKTYLVQQIIAFVYCMTEGLCRSIASSHHPVASFWVHVDQNPGTNSHGAKSNEASASHRGELSPPPPGPHGAYPSTRALGAMVVVTQGYCAYWHCICNDFFKKLDLHTPTVSRH